MADLIAFPVTSGGPPSSSLWPRLLTLEQAAVYCGLKSELLIRICPIPPIPAPRGGQRCYDRCELDSWIAGKCAPSNKNAWQDWVALMEGKEA